MYTLSKPELIKVIGKYFFDMRKLTCDVNTISVQYKGGNLKDEHTIQF